MLDSAQTNRLTGALIGLARATDGSEHLITPGSTATIKTCLRAMDTPEPADFAGLMALVEAEKRRMVPDCFTCACPCGKNSDYDLENLRYDSPEVRGLKGLLLCAVRYLASHDIQADGFFYKALIAVGMDGWSMEALLPIVLEAGDLCAPPA